MMLVTHPSDQSQRLYPNPTQPNPIHPESELTACTQLTAAAAAAAAAAADKIKLRAASQNAETSALGAKQPKKKKKKLGLCVLSSSSIRW